MKKDFLGYCQDRNANEPKKMSMIYHSLKILFCNAATTSGEMKLPLWCFKPELAQTHKGNCFKCAHLCFLILDSKTLKQQMS